MNNYLEHMRQVSSKSSFSRRVSYINYNYREYINSLSKKDKVLEIGPGFGELLELLNSKQITNIDIIDNDLGVLKYCSKKYKINKSILSKSLDLSRVLSTKYKLIVLTQVFEHIPKISYINWIQSMYNSLVPGGSIIITVPNGSNPFVGTERYGDLQHENIFNISSFDQLMSLCNLKNAEYHIQGFRIPPNGIISIIRIILQYLLHQIIIVMMIINGAIYQTLLTPNITLVITKGNSNDK